MMRKGRIVFVKTNDDKQAKMKKEKWQGQTYFESICMVFFFVYITHQGNCSYIPTVHRYSLLFPNLNRFNNLLLLKYCLLAIRQFNLEIEKQIVTFDFL